MARNASKAGVLDHDDRRCRLFILHLAYVAGTLAKHPAQQLFLRLSAVMQAAVLCALVCLYLLEPSLESSQALTAQENQRVLAYLPAYWFLGMLQHLNGSMQQEFVWLARRAYWMLGASMIGAAVTVLLSYVRILPKIVEQPEIAPVVRSFTLPAWMGALSTRRSLCSAYARSCAAGSTG